MSQKSIPEGSGPQRDVALAGLPYEVNFSGPQRDVGLAGLPYEINFSGPQRVLGMEV